MLVFGSHAGYGTGLLIAGALVFANGASTAGDPDFAGALVHPAQLRGAWPARLRDVWTAQTGSTSAARLRKPMPAQTKEAD